MKICVNIFPKKWLKYVKRNPLISVGIVFSVIAIPLTLFIASRPVILRQNAAGGATINPNLRAPTNLTALSLDSTIKGNWTPSTDPNVAWQVFSVWDQANQLISAKVLSKTAKAADGNGLAEGASYTIKVQSMDTTGALSNPITATATTDYQSPMPNAAFFENFQDTPPGNLNYNYFDVRTHDDAIDPDLDYHDATHVFANERHFHTQVIGGGGTRSVIIRPRVPFDFTNRIGTIQFEVDLPGLLSGDGKWWEGTVSKDIISNENELIVNSENLGAFSNSVTFGFFADAGVNPFMEDNKGPNVNRTYWSYGDGNDGYGFNIPEIIVNINGTRTVFTGTPVLTSTLISPANVRMPITFQLSQSSAELFMNGKSVLKATGFTLPFTKGSFSLAHRSDYGTKAFDFDYPQHPTLAFQLLHWDTIQYDGPAGSFSPVVKTYLQPGCQGVVHIYQGASLVEGCSYFPANNYDLTFNIPDDTTHAKTARLVFDTSAKSGSGSLSVNGNSTPFSLISHQLDIYPNGLQADEIDFPSSWLKQGGNTFHFSFSDTSAQFIQAELEVTYNQPRTIGNPALVPLPQIGVTTQNLRVERTTSDPMILNGTTYIYGLGSADPVTYNASVVTNDTDWLKITSPTTGMLISPVLGGGVVPLTFSVDFTNATCCAMDDGKIGVIKITGGVMPQYVAVLRAYYGLDHKVDILSNFPTNTLFNKDAIIGYHGGGIAPTTSTATTAPTATQTQPTTVLALTNTPTPLPTPLPTSAPTAQPSLPLTSSNGLIRRILYQ